MLYSYFHSFLSVFFFICFIISSRLHIIVTCYFCIGSDVYFISVCSQSAACLLILLMVSNTFLVVRKKIGLWVWYTFKHPPQRHKDESEFHKFYFSPLLLRAFFIVFLMKTFLIHSVPMVNTCLCLQSLQHEMSLYIQQLKIDIEKGKLSDSISRLEKQINKERKLIRRGKTKNLIKEHEVNHLFLFTFCGFT